MSDKIGCYKIEEFNHKELRGGEVIHKYLNKEPMIKSVTVKTHDITNKRDKKEINDIILRSKNMLLFLGELPGVGKTTTACNYECGKKLFVCPYNKLCQVLRQKGIDSITLNMLLGVVLIREVITR